jgi:pyridoxamine 5'-phosphate oxidase
MNMLNVYQLRKEYSHKPLEINDLSSNPFIQFHHWFQQAIEAQVLEPNAMILATASLQARPSCRTVLLKKMDEKRFVFFTNYESRKGRELQANPFASCTFFWKELERQVILEGVIERLSGEESESYFSQRPRESQLGAWASHQGQTLSSRQELETVYKEVKIRFEGKTIPLPPYWGGFALFPDRFEFWQGRPSRLHDRFQYLLRNHTWKIDRLAP